MSLRIRAARPGLGGAMCQPCSFRQAVPRAGHPAHSGLLRPALCGCQLTHRVASLDPWSARQCQSAARDRPAAAVRRAARRAAGETDQPRFCAAERRKANRQPEMAGQSEVPWMRDTLPSAYTRSGRSGNFANAASNAGISRHDSKPGTYGKPSSASPCAVATTSSSGQRRTTMVARARSPRACTSAPAIRRGAAGKGVSSTSCAHSCCRRIAALAVNVWSGQKRSSIATPQRSRSCSSRSLLFPWDGAESRTSKLWVRSQKVFPATGFRPSACTRSSCSVPAPVVTRNAPPSPRKIVPGGRVVAAPSCAWAARTSSRPMGPVAAVRGQGLRRARAARAPAPAVSSRASHRLS